MSRLPNVTDLHHPIQPVGMDAEVIRFKRNPLVRRCYADFERHSGGLNQFMREGISPSDPDYRQLMQLMGYSVSGYLDVQDAGEYDPHVGLVYNLEAEAIRQHQLPHSDADDDDLIDATP